VVMAASELCECRSPFPTAAQLHAAEVHGGGTKLTRSFSCVSSGGNAPWLSRPHSPGPDPRARRRRVPLPSRVRAAPWFTGPAPSSRGAFPACAGHPGKAGGRRLSIHPARRPGCTGLSRSRRLPCWPTPSPTAWPTPVASPAHGAPARRRGGRTPGPPAASRPASTMNAPGRLPLQTGDAPPQRTSTRRRRSDGRTSSVLTGEHDGTRRSSAHR